MFIKCFTINSFCAMDFLLLLLLILPFSAIAQTSNNISLGSSLTALEDGSSFWASPSGDFAFGFQRIGYDAFLLAIWFNKIPERTIVWSANGDNPVQKGSTAELTADGQFRLSDIATGKQIWMADSSSTRVSYAAMLDTGNFVLASENSINLWESFDYPTDTILPTQTLNQNSRLLARYTASNYSRGRFQFSLLPEGNLSLYTMHYPLDSASNIYWPTDTTYNGFQVIFNQSGSVYLTAGDGSIIVVLLNNTVPIQDFYQRATLEYNGVLRYYAYPKSNGSSAGRGQVAWSTLSFIPSDICMSPVIGIGSGACGYNSICRHDVEGPICECPYAYSLVDPNDVLKGCKPNFVSQNCDEASRETDLFDFQEMPDRDWPFSDYEVYRPVSEDWCKQSCLGDCFCAVAIMKEDQCWKKRIPLANGRIANPNTRIKSLIKIRKDNSTNTRKHDSSILKLNPFGAVLVGSSAFLNFIFLFITYFLLLRIIYYRKNKVSQIYPFINLKCYTYMELKQATNGFKEELGFGAFATVFKGVLTSENDKWVAVKRLDTIVGEDDFEFNTELRAIGRTNHRNLVQLLGFCNEGKHRILVYEFMSNGSLASFLFGASRPSWYRRREIALGTARGLFYLHEECSSQILHCDIKPQNILLDDTFTARIADFGVAKLLKIDQTRTTTIFRGTRGYVAPEWFKSLPVTVKADVYSFGILLLEIIFCRKNFEAKAEDEDQVILADWAYDCYKKNKLHLLLKNDDEAKDDIKMIEKYAKIAFWCIQRDQSVRPTMKNVTQMLEGAAEVSVPPHLLSLYVQFS